ncbi:hypothetical protein SAMN05660420_02284 [Desulfuromusa kysingii]|uniref:Uncharacterized protein n=1 Tax=Desulfuromusa kysingii TaxID=37625 RepID=A0A1H4BMI1_9BACT|nr:hypothetical protein [Desulfuromusa kysingii]SEA49341.1 hypothetical protein SAMN05660420_02284 [Desulfuromusa kysingii]
MNRIKIIVLTSLVCLLVSVIGAAAQDLIPVYDQDTSLWGYAMEKPMGEKPVDWIIDPQFSWAGHFYDGMASAIIGCRYADCKFEPSGRKLYRRAHVAITPDFKRKKFVAPEDNHEFEKVLFNDMSLYAIANDNYAHIGRFSSDVPGYACVKLKVMPKNLKCKDYYVDKQGHLKVMLNGEMVSAD